MKKKQNNRYEKDWNAANAHFSNIFISMQLISFTALYSDLDDGGFDFSKQKLKNFNDFMSQHNKEIISHDIDRRGIETQFKKIGFDCEEAASNFPYRAKLKMCNKKLKTKHDYNVMIASANVAISAYLVLALYTLKKHYAFTHADMRKWWTKCLDIANLYSSGMTNEFVVQFNKDECGLEISL